MSFVQTFLPLYFFSSIGTGTRTQLYFHLLILCPHIFRFFFFSMLFLVFFVHSYFFLRTFISKTFFALRLEKIIELAPETDVRIIMSFSGTSFRARLRSCSVLMIVS